MDKNELYRYLSALQRVERQPVTLYKERDSSNWRAEIILQNMYRFPLLSDNHTKSDITIVGSGESAEVARTNMLDKARIELFASINRVLGV